MEMANIGGENIASTLLSYNMDPGALRPWRAKSGRSYVTLFNGYDNNGEPTYKNVLVTNAPALLRKDEWIQFDEEIVRAALPRLTLWSDIESAGLRKTIPNGMGTTVLQYQQQKDFLTADVSMDGLTADRRDRPTYETVSLPLPIIHADFSFSAREIALSRNMNTPLDTESVVKAGRRIGEMIESFILGRTTLNQFGNDTIYGITTFPNRLTYNITYPTAVGWTPTQTNNDVLAMMQLCRNNYFYGPWSLYFSNAWGQYLDQDYSAAKGTETLRQRLLANAGITSIQTIDTWTGSGNAAYQIALVQKTSDVIRCVTGMELVTLQWPEQGSMLQRFKAMTIKVPQPRADYSGRTGIVHGA